jgi:EmrB/QacA subfamily drug resistance transporter
MAIGLAIITAVFPPNERGKALGIGGSIVSIGIMTGPIVGGFIISAASWRWIFFINIPVGIIGSLAVLKILKKDEVLKKPRFDILGAVVLFICLAALMLALNQGERLGWTSPSIIFFFVLFVATLVSFIVIEMRSREPIIELGIFKNRLFSTSVLSSLISFLVLFTVVIRMPFYLQDVLNYEPYQIGMILTAMPIAMSAASPISGWISDRIGSRLLTTIGLSIVTVTLVLMSSLNASSSWLDVFARLSMLGIGLGVFMSPNTSAIMGSVPKRRLGMGSGIVATMRNTGMVLGIAFSGAVLSASCGLLGPSMTAGSICVGGMNQLYIVSAIICLFGVIVTFSRGGRFLPERKVKNGNKN